MRRALATATIAGAVALVPLTAVAAHAEQPLAAGVVASTDDTDKDEPALQDGNDDSGKYGLIGLSGLFGLFGYKKYRDHQASRAATTSATTGSTGTDGTSHRV